MLVVVCLFVLSGFKDLGILIHTSFIFCRVPVNCFLHSVSGFLLSLSFLKSFFSISTEIMYLFVFCFVTPGSNI